MAFRFPLESVLRVRESLEKREELALQKIQMQIAQTQNLIENADKQLARIHAARADALENPVPARTLHLLQLEEEGVNEIKKSLFQSLAELEKQSVQQKAVYQAAHSNRQMLTDMKDQRRTEFDLEQTKTQQKRLDDIFAARSQRS